MSMAKKGLSAFGAFFLILDGYILPSRSKAFDDHDIIDRRHALLATYAEWPFLAELRTAGLTFGFRQVHFLNWIVNGKTRIVCRYG
jgi:hypothetical protein